MKGILCCKWSRVNDKEFTSSDKTKIKDIGCKIASTITSRIYKGIDSDNSNCVLVVYEK